MKFGLKLFSTNAGYVKPARELYERGAYDYIELYSQPDSYENSIGLWKGLDIPFQVHAPHFGDGMNLAKKEQEARNTELAREALRFADSLKAGIVVFHPGVDGNTGETIRQLRGIGDSRIVVENKPYYSVDGKWTCNGHSPEELKQIMAETGAGFCLDFGHAICSANAKKIPPLDYIRQFNGLKPALYHLTDGNFHSPYDSHEHFGDGTYPIAELLSFVPADSRVTNEAKKDSPDNLDDFVRDMERLRKATESAN